ncbi:hypothetical protein MRX96_029842 [Rhipicephalus microplus]
MASNVYLHPEKVFPSTRDDTLNIAQVRVSGALTPNIAFTRQEDHRRPAAAPLLIAGRRLVRACGIGAARLLGAAAGERRGRLEGGEEVKAKQQQPRHTQRELWELRHSDQVPPLASKRPGA